MYQLSYTPYVLPFLVSLLITSGLGVYAWRHRHQYAAGTFAGVMLAMTVWTLCYALELCSDTLEGKLLWAQSKYLGSTVGPVLWFVLALKLSRHEHWLAPPLQLLLMAFCIVTCLVVFTDDQHHWFWRDMHLVEGEPESQAEHGPYFWVYAATIYSLVLITVVMLFRYFRDTPGFYRRQAALLALGGFIPLGGRILEDFFKIDIFPHVDNIIVLFLVSGVLFGVAIFRFGAFSLVHIGHHLVIRDIGAGIIVLDVAQRVVELNPYASALIAPTHANPLGQPVHKLLENWPQVDLAQLSGQEMALGERWFQLQGTRILAENGELAGYSVVIFDISARKQAEAQLAMLARMDALTGLANRRHFDELAVGEFARARRLGHPLTVMMFDIDHFKRINDQYGHPVGDEVIRCVADIGRQQLRALDPLARYGGEEFIGLLLECPLGPALEMAERIRRAVAEVRLPIAGLELSVTVSLGLASLTDECAGMDELISRADQALYSAKKEGRNRVCSWGSVDAAAQTVGAR